jgi:hypothetical protein
VGADNARGQLGPVSFEDHLGGTGVVGHEFGEVGRLGVVRGMGIVEVEESTSRVRGPPEAPGTSR